jgi:hypothetical protein
VITTSLTIDVATSATAVATSMPGVVIGVPGIPGPRATRQSATVTTAALADGSVEDGAVALAAGYRLYAVSADRACRVRLYIDAAHRTSDAARPAGVDPLGDHGCIADFVFTAPGVLNTSPLVDGFVTSGIMVPYAVENQSGAASPVQVGLTWLRTE